MLAEAAAAAPEDELEPPPKRRRLSPDRSTSPASAIVEPEDPPSQRQIVYDDFEGSDDDDDAEFEDVDLAVSDVEEKPEQKVLTVDLSEPIATPKRSTRRPPITNAERKMRLEWHKAHLYLLLLSLWYRNRWCESTEIHAILKPLVPRKIVKLLHEDESAADLQRSHSFNKGIEELCLLWRTTWTNVGRGMRRAHWRNDIKIDKESKTNEDLDFDDFKTAAHTLEGSRDLGAQLFCALLRSVAVETRLVSSLQVLPFSTTPKGQTPVKSKQDYTYAAVQDFGSSSSNIPRKKQKDSPFPIYWVEVLSPVTSMWIPIDAIVRHTINKPKTGYEPPASDSLNAMLYVIAFEDDGSAKDVTRRYSQWYNAKTRKCRVESTKGGDEWWQKTMSLFTKVFPELSDELEEADLLRRSEAEGMPKNVQDFKGHPIYVLERHLRMNEVIHPKREVGKTSIGVGSVAATQKLESVFRRQDVHLCRTSDAWYRRGRDIRQGETPLKRVSRKSRPRPDVEEQDDGEDDDAALYAEFQTEVYQPPLVVNGRIPRNAFGNLDVYVPSMIPPGAIHVQHPLALKAAKVLGVDYAEAVTGFEFKGRQGTAIVNGVVVARDVRYGLDAVIFALQSDAISDAQGERSRLLLSLWKRWMTALRIRERVQREYGGGSDEDLDEDATYEASDEDDGGGFVPETAPASGPHPQGGAITGKDALSKLLLKGLPSMPVYREITVVESPHKVPVLTVRASPVPRSSGQVQTRIGEDVMQGGGGFVVEDGEEAGGFLLGTKAPAESSQDIDNGGGFMVEEDPPKVTSADASQSRPREQFEEAIAHLKRGRSRTPQYAPDEAFLVPSKLQNGRAKPPIETGSVALAATSSSRSDKPNPAGSQGSDPEVTSPGGSMLSHDPEEDDAEPDWLLDSLGD